jgi:hypothetical protein
MAKAANYTTAVTYDHKLLGALVSLGIFFTE